MIDDNIEPLYLTKPDYKIATKTIKLNCLELEFQHQYSVLMIGFPSRYDIRVVGTVPLSISGEGDTATIHGTGTLKITHSGYHGPQPGGTIIFSEEGTLKAVIKGKLEEDKSSGNPILKLDIDEFWEVRPNVTITIPGTGMSISQPSQYTPRHDRGYPFPVIDGYTMEVKGPLPSFGPVVTQGGPKIILHLKKK